MPTDCQMVLTPQLEIGCLMSGPVDGAPVVLMHGFPYDPHAYDAVASGLADRGFRTFAPYMRGYGPTRFLDEATFRSGEQAAFTEDLLALMDALELARPLLVGYDWGGRAACGVAALWPERVRGLVSVTGYNLFGAPGTEPRDPDLEHRHWYQHYLCLDRGRGMLEARLDAFTRFLWRQWSPSWEFDDVTFARSARSFENPDFVEVVLHSYRHRHAVADGDPALANFQARLEAKPEITVPTIVLHGDEDFPVPVSGSADPAGFSGPYARRVIAGVGHNLPQEAPGEVIDAVLDLASRT